MTQRYIQATTVLIAAAAIALASSAKAQSEDPPSPRATRNAQVAQLVDDGQHAPLGAGSFSGYCAYHYAGTHVLATCYDYRINANSRVFASLSEYSNLGPNSGRFMGSARMTTHNVVPFNGGVTVWTDVEWGSALNVRMDLLVDP